MNDVKSGLLVTKEEYMMTCKEYDKEIAELERINAELNEKLRTRQQDTNCIVIPCKPYCIGCNMIELEREDVPFPENEISHRCKHQSFCHYQWNRWDQQARQQDYKSVVISEP